MELDTVSTRGDRYVDRSISDFQHANHNPIDGYLNLPLMTLEEAVERIVPYIDGIQNYVCDAKLKCKRDSNIMTLDQSAAIYLYTMPISFFSKLNQALRAENRNSLKPWFAFLKLFMSALEKLPSLTDTVWRAVATDVGSYSLDNNLRIWWSVNSCSTDLNVIQMYLGETTSTLFAIAVKNGKRISDYSPFQDEQEIILMPGTHLRLKSNPLERDRLKIIHLEELPRIEHGTTRLGDLQPKPTIEQDTQRDFEDVSLACLTSANNSSSDISADIPLLSVHENDPENVQLRISNRVKRYYSTIKITIGFTIGIILLIVGTISVIVFTKTSHSTSTITNDQASETSISDITLTSSRETLITTAQVPHIFCTHRRFRIIADILYSFDCSNVTDDITGTYNGVPAIPPWISNNTETAKAILPVYVTPDYSGQGAALKLNSSIKYQYIQLLRSPVFFNQTFTISVWLYPNVQASTIYNLISQTYLTAPALIFSIVDLRIVMRVYKTVFWSTSRLKNLQWQHITLAFAQEDLSFAIHINGILDATNRMEHPEYGNFEIQRTNIGSYDGFNQYNGLMDQFAIAFRIKSYVDILDEATLVVQYNFDDEGTEGDLFKDNSVNSIRAQGSHVSRVIGSRRPGYNTLSLYDPVLSYFRTGGFVLLSTHNYSYSYVLWLHVSNMSSFIPLIHLVTKSELPSSSLESNNSTCLSLLAVNRTDDNHFQLFVYICGLENSIVIISTTIIAYSTWFHVVVMSETNNFSLYLNGILVASSTSTNININKVSHQQRLILTIGNPLRGSNNDTLDVSLCNINKSDGQSNNSVISIDDLRFYSRALKVKEIQALKNDNHDATRYFFE